MEELQVRHWIWDAYLGGLCCHCLELMGKRGVYQLVIFHTQFLVPELRVGSAESLEMSSSAKFPFASLEVEMKFQMAHSGYIKTFLCTWGKVFVHPIYKVPFSISACVSLPVWSYELDWNAFQMWHFILLK